MQYASLESFKKVLALAIDVSIETSGIQGTKAQGLASDFLLKNLMVSLVIWSIVNPTKSEDFQVGQVPLQLYDFPSAYVLVRSLFEGYINMNYLLLDPASDGERDFRLLIWERHALKERQRMATSIGSQHKQLEDDKKRIEELIRQIEESDYFRYLPQSEQQFWVKTKKWTRSKTLERGDKANIHRSQSEFIYKFLSNYAHSESFALMQISAVRSLEESRELCNVPRNYAEMFLSLTLSAVAKVQSIADRRMKGDKILTEIVNFWEGAKTRDIREILGTRIQ